MMKKEKYIYKIEKEEIENTNEGINVYSILAHENEWEGELMRCFKGDEIYILGYNADRKKWQMYIFTGYTYSYQGDSKDGSPQYKIEDEADTKEELKEKYEAKFCAMVI